MPSGVELDDDDEDTDPKRKLAGALGPADLDIEAQIDDLAAALEFDDLEAEDDVVELEELEADLDAEPAGPVPLYLELDGQVHVVDQDRYVIGRVSKLCDLTIVDMNISRQHCAIERRDRTYVIVDLGSTNGIELHGERVDNHEIVEGDLLELSGHELHCSFVGPPPDEVMPALERAAPEPSAPSVTHRLTPVAAVVPEPQVAPQQVFEAAPAPVFEPPPQAAPAPVAHAWPDPSASFEARVELRLAALADQVALLQQTVQYVLGQVQRLEVDALAQLIQSRLRQAKRDAT